MPSYIWDFICGELDDGTYQFPEGCVTVKNGYASWKPKKSEED